MTTSPLDAAKTAAGIRRGFLDARDHAFQTASLLTIRRLWRQAVDEGADVDFTPPPGELLLNSSWRCVPLPLVIVRELQLGRRSEYDHLLTSGKGSTIRLRISDSGTITRTFCIPFSRRPGMRKCSNVTRPSASPKTVDLNDPWTTHVVQNSRSISYLNTSPPFFKLWKRSGAYSTSKEACKYLTLIQRVQGQGVNTYREWYTGSGCT